MENRFVEALLEDSRKGDGFLRHSDFDCLDVLALDEYFARIFRGELKDEMFDFTEFSKIATKVYRLLLTIDKLGGAMSKDVVRLVIMMVKFAHIKTSEKGISLTQCVIASMVHDFLNNELTGKPIDMVTMKHMVFDREDQDKKYSDKYFSFFYEFERYTVKTNTFDLSDILSQLQNVT